MRLLQDVVMKHMHHEYNLFYGYHGANTVVSDILDCQHRMISIELNEAQQEII